MKSRTSSCNIRVFKKDITRFAPIWVEYSVLLLVIYYFLVDGDTDITSRYSWFLNAFAYVNAIYGFICGVALFGYLSDSRECNAVHAFPIRREEYFIIHTVAGFLMALVPNFLFCLLNIPLVSGNPAVLFGGMMLQFTFFYSLAIFCVFLTGRKFAAATLYALLNWLSMLIMWALEVIYLPLMPGIELSTEAFYQFCPVIMMSFEDLVEFEVWHGVPDAQMQAIIIYAIVGLVLLAASLVMYRKRKLEYAGDFIAVKWLTPVFVVALSIACGCVLGAFTTVFGTNDSTYVLLGVGLVVGYFTGMMLLKRTVRVFNLKSLGGAAAVVAVVFLSIFVTEMDPFGRVNYVPEAEAVASVQISHYKDSRSYYESTDPAVIADVVDLHGDVLDCGFDRDDYEYDDRICLTYRLKNGQTIVRYYIVYTKELSSRCSFYYSQPEVLLGVSSLEELKEKCRYMYIESYRSNSGIEEDYYYTDTLTKDQQDAFLETLFRECREGKMDTYSYTSQWSIYLSIQYNNDESYWIPIPETATDTRAMAKELIEVPKIVFE